MLEISALAIKGLSYKVILNDTAEYLIRHKDRFFPYFGNRCRYQ